VRIQSADLKNEFSFQSFAASSLRLGGKTSDPANEVPVSYENEKKKSFSWAQLKFFQIPGQESFSHIGHSALNTLTYKHFHTRQSTSTTPRVAHIGWP